MPVDRVVQYPAEANDQAAAERKRVYGLIGVYAAVVIIVVIVGVSCRVNRGEELCFQLNAYAGRNIDIRPYLYSGRKMSFGRIIGSVLRRKDICAQQDAEERPNCRIGDRAGEYESTHDIILVEVAADQFCSIVIAIIVQPR